MKHLVALLAIAGCGSPPAKPVTNAFTPEPAASIVIGAVYTDPDTLAGIEIAVGRERVRRTPEDLPVEVWAIDARAPFDAELQRLLTEGDPAVLIADGDALAVARLEARVGAGGPPVVTMAIADDVPPLAMARFALDRGWTHAGAVVPMPEDPQVEWAPIEALFQRAGGALQRLGDYWLPGNGLRPLLEAAAAAGASVVLVPGDPGGTCLAKSFFGRTVSLEYVGMATAKDRRRMERDRCDGVFFVTRFAPDDPDATGFVADFRARFDRAPTEAAALGHDAAVTVLDAIRRAPTLSRADVRATLETIEDLRLATGVFDADTGNRTMAVVEIVGGKPRFVTRVSAD